MAEQTEMETVLIVDDEKTFLLSLKDGLKIHEKKFRVLTAESGKEAITLLRAIPIALLITDLKMPEVDGFELLAWTTREKPEMPVIVMTAFGTADIESRLAEIDSLQYLEKPLALADLESAIFIALKAKARSYIRGISLATFLQLMHMEKKSCTLKITQGKRIGYLFFKGGVLFDADFEGLQGEAAAYEIVAWDDAEIEMDSHCRRQEQVINASLEHLLIDAFRRKDEKLHVEAASRPLKLSGESEQTINGSSSRAEKPTPSPEVAVRMQLVEILNQHPGVHEYVIFDKTGFLENRNEGACHLENFDAELFLSQVDSLDEILSFGSFSHIVMTTASRHHCLLFRNQGHRVVAQLVKGQRPADVMKQVKQAIRAKAS